MTEVLSKEDEPGIDVLGASTGRRDRIKEVSGNAPLLIQIWSDEILHKSGNNENGPDAGGIVNNLKGI